MFFKILKKGQILPVCAHTKGDHTQPDLLGYCFLCNVSAQNHQANTTVPVNNPFKKNLFDVRFKSEKFVLLGSENVSLLERVDFNFFR